MPAAAAAVTTSCGKDRSNPEWNLLPASCFHSQSNRRRTMKILVAGANGLTGTRAVRRLKEAGHAPVAMIRKAAQEKKFREMEIETVVADLEEALDHAVRGMDGIIFAAGSGSKTGPDKTVDVDRNGAIRLIDAAAEHGASRFVMLSAMGTRDPEGSPIEHYLRAKRDADEHLEAADLDWTIVRPGRLTNDPGTGHIDAGTTLGRRGEISRDDVADVIIRCFDIDGTVGKNFELLSGDTPIDEALRAL
jgi:uncharacterized protein YbjT (DUF2867 family)